MFAISDEGKDADENCVEISSDNYNNVIRLSSW